MPPSAHTCLLSRLRMAGTAPVRPAANQRHRPCDAQMHHEVNHDETLAVTRRAVFIAWMPASLLLASRADKASALALAPLGPDGHVGGTKRTGLAPEEVKAIIERDLSEGMYFVTGDLTPEVFADDCRFIDPTNDVTGLSKYIMALGILFDPAYSKVESLGVRVTGPRTIEADWKLGGYLRLPWNPRVKPLKGHTVYTLNDQGLIQTQKQEWSISAGAALFETFTPTFEPKRQLF